MNPEKRKRLEAAGWKVGSAEEFLGLTRQERLAAEYAIREARRIEERSGRRSTENYLYDLGIELWVVAVAGDYPSGPPELLGATFSKERAEAYFEEVVKEGKHPWVGLYKFSGGMHHVRHATPGKRKRRKASSV